MSNFRLLDLPRELRDCIYACATSESDPVEIVEYRTDKLMYTLNRQPSLAVVSRRLKEEVLSVYYGTNEFCFHTGLARNLPAAALTRVKLGPPPAGQPPQLPARIVPCISRNARRYFLRDWEPIHKRWNAMWMRWADNRGCSLVQHLRSLTFVVPIARYDTTTARRWSLAPTQTWVLTYGTFNVSLTSEHGLQATTLETLSARSRERVNKHLGIIEGFRNDFNLQGEALVLYFTWEADLWELGSLTWTEDN